nr:PREDICTED: uncharacterized protein KIAA1107 homolog isoform X1 [Latimeria chalumnae]|eukprot:XP_014339437.1 PREDICTED: uncharacterized protein KIAA1107 homolog isoform X1 [Latimeria chalumnae]
MGLESLYAACMRWIAKYFVKCYSERNFSVLPPELQRACLTNLVLSINQENAAFILMESDRLISSLPGVKWAEKALGLASELQEECINFIMNHFLEVIKGNSFHNLLKAQGMSSKPYLLERIFAAIERSITIENSCFQFLALDTLKNIVSNEMLGFTCEIQALCDKLWIFLMQSFYAVRHTEGWKLMNVDDREKIQAAAFDKGDDRRLGKKPAFSSSQQNRCSSVTSKVSKQPSWELKGKIGSWSHLSTTKENMKSDGLCTSAHAMSSGRNSINKVTKTDDIRGKDDKKIIPKTRRDDSGGQNISAKPKAAVKLKSENSGNVKAEGSVTKEFTETSVSAKGQINVTSTRGAGNSDLKNTGARPKIPASTSNAQTKSIKTLKKAASKELSPSIKGKSSGTAGSVKSVSSSSPNTGGVLEDDDDESEKNKVPAVKPKSVTKITSASLGTKKIPSAGSSTSNSTVNKPNMKGGSGQNQQMQMKTLITTSSNSTAQQRVKSAPAAPTKNQEPKGVSSTTQKPVPFPKQCGESKQSGKSSAGDNSTACNGLTPVRKKTLKQTSSKTVMHATENLSNLKKTSTNKTGQKLRNSSVQCASNTQAKTGKELQANKNACSHTKKETTSKECSMQNTMERKPNLIPFHASMHKSKVNYNVEQNNGMYGPMPPLPNHKSHPHVNMEEKIFSPEVSSQQFNTESCIMFQNVATTDFVEKVVDGSENTAKVNDFVSDWTSISHEAKSQVVTKTVVELCGETYSIVEKDTTSSTLDKKEEARSAREPLTNNINEDHLNKQTKEYFEHKDVLGVNMDNETNTFLRSEYPDSLCNLKQEKSPKPVLGLSEQGNVTNQGTEVFVPSASLHLFTEQAQEKYVSDLLIDADAAKTPESHGDSDLPFADQWNSASGILTQRESPESDTGSATTSSDDIKPRSEDYDAGGSQDDDGSNERGISKCSTMLCHDFLGRSSSDTSTPEELKMYDSGLRVEVKIKNKETSDTFHVPSTSGGNMQRKTELWSHQESVTMEKAGEAELNVQVHCTNEQLSSADETEDERSEAEDALERPPPAAPDHAAHQFQGIVNLGFEDVTENDTEVPEFSKAAHFKCSFLLSVDECEELGSDEGEVQTPPYHSLDSLTPSDVFDGASHDNHGSTYYSRYSLEIEDGFLENGQPDREKSIKQDKNSSFLSPNDVGFKGKDEKQNALLSVAKTRDESISGAKNQVSDSHPGGMDTDKCQENILCNSDQSLDSEIRCQERPCHLELHCAGHTLHSQKNNSEKAIDQVRTGQEQVKGTSTTSAQAHTVLDTGHLDDCDQLAQTCIYDRRPSKTLSPIYEMDVGEAVEQTMEQEVHLMDLGQEENECFAERDWTLLRQLLSDQDSNLGIINSVPEDLNLAQYLINQTLLLSRDSSKTRGKLLFDKDTISKWTELMSPLEDSTNSITVASFSPEDTTSTEGEWTIVELETHH